MYLDGPYRGLSNAGWYALTNAWGSGALKYGTDYTVGMAVNPADVVDGSTYNWDYPPIPATAWSKILAYPQVAFGPSPKGDLYDKADTTNSLPIAVKDIGSFTSNFDLSYGGNKAGYDVSYDFFYTSTPYGDKSTLTNELMIWLHAGDVAPFGVKLGTYTDASFSGDIYYDAASHYTAIISNTDLTAGSVDIGAMMKTLEKLGIMSGEEYFETFQLGAEVIGGAGTLTINALDADIVTNGINGPAQEKLITGTGSVVTAAPLGAPVTSGAVFDAAPTKLTFNHNVVNERLAAGATVGTLSATDPEGQTISYSLLDNADGRFSINAATGVVTTNSTLYYADAASYNVTVRATDAGGASTDGTFLIGVTKVNQAPVNLKLSNAAIAENVAIGSVVGTASATDPQGTALTYSLVTSAGAFAINATTGVLTTSAALNYESRSSYAITVRATDSLGLYVDQPLTIAVRDVNEAPTKLALDHNRVVEKQAAGTVIGTALATDPDKGDVLSYSLSDDAGGVFKIGAQTGVLVTAVPLDYAAKHAYTVTIRATDTAGNVFDKTYSVNVSRADATATNLVVNKAPTLTVDQNTVVQGQAVGTLIGTAHAVDPEHTDLTYSLVGSTLPFAIDSKTGAITTTASLDLSSYALTVRATDATGLSTDAALALAITANTATPPISGGPGNDVLTGTSGTDILDGGAGADVMTGGDGDDSYYVDNVGDQVNETWNNGKGGTDTVYAAIDYTLPFNVENLVLTGTANLDGTGGMNNNVITGNSGDNVLTGLAGYDTLYGGAGNDTLSGGADNDTLYGGAGNDVLDGGTGVDTMWGGDGNDAYYVDNTADRVLEVYNGGLGGTDTIYSSVSYTTPGSVENLTLTGTANINATGGVNNNVLKGNSGNNVLTGGGGNDTLIGGGGTDTAWFAGKSSGYQIKTVGGQLTVVDTDPNDGNAGTDTLSQIEKIYFAGDNVTMSVVPPIILDLSGAGVSLTSMSQSDASFDMDGDGIADKTAWFGKGSALLFLDRNGDGTLTDASEMSFTDDKTAASSDLDGLTSFDTNGDGVLSAADSQFASFKLFVDANGDGAVETGEIKSLADLGVASITLAGTAVNGMWQPGDAMVLNTGSFTFTDGHTGSFADVAFSYQASVIQQAAQALAEATSAFTAVAATIDPLTSDLNQNSQFTQLLATQEVARFM